MLSSVTSRQFELRIAVRVGTVHRWGARAMTTRGALPMVNIDPGQSSPVIIEKERTQPAPVVIERDTDGKDVKVDVDVDKD